MILSSVLIDSVNRRANNNDNLMHKARPLGDACGFDYLRKFHHAIKSNLLI